MVCPELLCYQMSTVLPIHVLVMLGHELCGSYSLPAAGYAGADVVMNIPAVTSVERIERYLDALCESRSAKEARLALRYIANNALSFPEALLSTVCAIPADLCGYGLGPITLNKRVRITDAEEAGVGSRNRYPDLLFPFAPIGINYEGEGHLDLNGLMQAAKLAERAEGDEFAASQAALAEKHASVRAKYVDDIRRDRELASRSYLVVRATKEDLVDGRHLDVLIQQILESAQAIYGVDTTKHIKMLENTDMRRDRHELVRSLMQIGVATGAFGHYS